jgi:hypothetical protein
MLLTGFLLRLYLVWRPFMYLDNLFIPDDAYISLKIAKNLASGLGMTFDGIHLTNGFQCLYAFLLTPFYLFCADDIITPIHIALTFSSLCDIVTLILVYKIVLRLSDKSSALFSAFLWCFSPSIISNTLNGLETSLNVLLIAACTYFYITKIREKETVHLYHLILGLLLGFLLLARIDSIFFVLAVCLDLLWINRPLAHAIKQKSFLKNIARITIGGLVILVPWWLIELYYLQSLIPESFKSLQIHLSFRPIFLGWNFFLSLYHLANFPFLAGSRLKFHFFALMASKQLVTQLIVLTILFLIIGSLVYGLQRFLKKTTTGNVIFLLVYSLLLFLFYNLYLPVFWFFKRYYHPIALTIVIYCGLFFFLLNKRWLQNRSKLVKSMCIAICYILIAFSFAPSLKLFIRGTPEHTIDKDIFGAKGYYSPAKVAAKTIPPGTRVGAFQSGAFGYFLNENLVFNLDGKVNRDALNALLERRMFAYLKSQEIEYLIAWDFNLDYFLLQRSQYSKDYISKKLLPMVDLPSQGKQVFRIYKIEQGDP